MIGPRIGLGVGVQTGPAIGLGQLAGVQSELTVAIADSADPVTGDDDFTYTIDVENTDSDDAIGVSVTITLDSSVTWVSTTGTGWTLGHVGQIVTATLATLAPGAADPIVVTVTAPLATSTLSTRVDVSALNAPAVNDTETTAVTGVTRDAISGIYVPSSSAEWTLFISARGLSTAAPNSLWLCQEASGNLADSIGSLTLTAAGTPVYQHDNPFWTRKGLYLGDGQSNRFVAASGVGPSPATTSTVWLGMFYFPGPPVVTGRAFWGPAVTSGATGCRARFQTTGKLLLETVTDDSPESASVHSVGRHPIAVRYDRANSVSKIYSDLDELAGVYSAGVLDQNKGLGAAATGSSEVEMVWGCMWSGAAAEAFDDAKMKALLEAMGWTIPWS